MKRILVVAVAAILAWGGFTFFSNHAGAEAHAAEHGHEHEHEEVDFDNIPKQVDAVDLKMGEAVDRVMDATIAANGQLVLRAQNKGDVASLMGGVVKAIYVKEGQNVKRGQVVALVENTDVVSLQREYFSASKECELALADLERQKLLNKAGAGVKRNAQQAAKEYHVAHANLIGIGKQLAQMGISSQGQVYHSLPFACSDCGYGFADYSQLGQLCRHADSAHEDSEQPGDRVRFEHFRERFAEGKAGR